MPEQRIGVTDETAGAGVVEYRVREKTLPGSRTPPTQHTGSPFQTGWTTGATKTAGGGLAVGVGDLIVVQAMGEDSGQSFSTPTNVASSPATITWTRRANVSVGSRCEGDSWTGQVTAAGNLTVSVAETVGNQVNWGMVVYAFPASGHGGLGLTPAGANGSGSGPTLTGAWTADSMICCACGDWSAVAHGPPRDYRTGAGSATEVNYANVDGNYSTEAWYHADANGGSNAVGLATPNMTWTLIVIEVLGPLTAGPTVEEQYLISQRQRIITSRQYYVSQTFVLAAADGATSYRWLLRNPDSSGLLVGFKLLELMSTIVNNALAVPSSPRFTLERWTSTGTPSGGTTLSPGEVEASGTPVAVVYTGAPTGLTNTKIADVFAFLPSVLLVGGGTTNPNTNWPLTQDYHVYGDLSVELAAGEALAIRQADAGTATESTHRIMQMSFEIEEYTLP